MQFVSKSVVYVWYEGWLWLGLTTNICKCGNKSMPSVWLFDYEGRVQVLNSNANNRWTFEDTKTLKLIKLVLELHKHVFTIQGRQPSRCGGSTGPILTRAWKGPTSPYPVIVGSYTLSYLVRRVRKCARICGGNRLLASNVTVIEYVGLKVEKTVC